MSEPVTTPAPDPGPVRTAPALAPRTSVSLVLAFAVLGALGGGAWIALAEPPLWRASGNGFLLTEMAAGQRFEVLAIFGFIGLVLTAGAGAITGLVLRDRGWPLVVVTIVAGVIAGLVAWRVGVAFGPDGIGRPGGVDVGETVAESLTLDSWAPFLLWALGAVAGLTVTTWLRPPAAREPDIAA